MKQSQKDDIYKFICDNKFRIFNRINKEELFKSFLKENKIDFPFEIKISNVIKYLKNIDTKCLIEGCNNERKFIGIRNDNRTEFGFRKYCSKECEYKSISIRQSGLNNTCHRMSVESFNSMRKKNSILMKNKIKNGEFIPNITNSWNKGTSYLILNNKKIKYRSSWEAFFHLCNTHLEYEKVIIQYEYKNIISNYITDFVDHEKRKIYEIKPISLRKRPRVKAKEIYCLKWCLENEYELIFIDDIWFLENFKINKELLKYQPDGYNINKKLKQFDEN